MSVPGADALRLLVVCTANQCRSPIAEQLFARQIEWRRLNWTVSSAGCRTRGGAPLHKLARRVLRRRGIEVDPDWTSSALDTEVLDRADLVLVADQQNWSDVVRQQPSVADRTFLLLQFARLIAAVDELPGQAHPSGADLPEAARRMQARIQPLPLAELEVRDPIGQPYRRFRACADQIGRSVEQILNARPRS